MLGVPAQQVLVKSLLAWLKGAKKRVLEAALTAAAAAAAVEVVNRALKGREMEHADEALLLPSHRINGDGGGTMMRQTDVRVTAPDSSVEHHSGESRAKRGAS